MRTVATAEFEGGSVFIDGDWKPLSEARISLFDWGFTRSDAAYDVVTAWRGAFFRLDDHLDRFFSSLAKVRMQIPYSRAEVRQILHGCVRAGGLKDAYVAMLCTRGVPPRGARDHVWRKTASTPTRFPSSGSPRRTSRPRGSTCTSAVACASRRSRSTRRSRPITGWTS